MQGVNTQETLTKIASNLKHINSLKRDMVAPASKLVYHDSYIWVQTGASAADAIPFLVNENFHSQMAEKLDIPMKYYRRMRSENVPLMEESINSWLTMAKDKKYLLRCLNAASPKENSIARALLSDSYNCIDNYDVLGASLEAIRKMGVKVEVLRAEVTEKRLYLQVCCPEIEEQATAFLKDYMKTTNKGVGNRIMSGFSLANSEVGLGGYNIFPRAVIGKCTNGLVLPDDGFKKIHLGGKLEEGEIMWSKETRQKNYALVISQTQDAITKFLSKDYLGKMIEKVAVLNDIKIDHRIDTVKHVCNELSITDHHMENILAYFMQDGDPNASGVLNAITRESQNMNADLQYDVENNVFNTIVNIKKFDKPFGKN